MACVLTSLRALACGGRRLIGKPPPLPCVGPSAQLQCPEESSVLLASKTSVDHLAQGVSMWSKMNIVIKKLTLLRAQEGMTENRMQEGFLEDPGGGTGSNSQTQMGIINKEPNHPQTYTLELPTELKSLVIG